MHELAEPVRLMLAWAVLPLWLLAGLADWACHRRGDIGHTAGVGESLLHLLLFGLLAAALAAVLLLELNAGALLLALALWLLHQLLSWLELRYVLRRRTVGPFEQMVHSAQEWLPLLGLALLALMVVHRWLLLPEGAERVWALRWRRPEEDPVLTGWRVWPALAAFTALGALPLAEELRRTWRERPSPPAGSDGPAPP